MARLNGSAQALAEHRAQVVAQIAKNQEETVAEVKGLLQARA